MIKQLSRQLFKLSAQYRRVFLNAMEEFYIKLMPASSMVQKSSHQVLGERWISSMHFMVTKKNEPPRQWNSHSAW